MSYLDEVYIVSRDNGTSQPELLAFEDQTDADTYAGVRGGCDMECLDVINHADAQRMINREAKERMAEQDPRV